MTYGFAFLLTLTAQPSLVPLKSRVVEAAIFKTGQCLVVREFDLKKGDHRYRLDVLPDAFDGTVWYITPKTARITGLETKIQLNSEKRALAATTPIHLLLANVRRTVTLRTRDKRTVTGRLLSVSDPNNPSVTVESAGGETNFLSVTEIASISGAGLKRSIQATVKSYQVGIEFRAGATEATKGRIITMEYGAVWASSYLLNLGHASQATIMGKAQLASGALGFNGTQVKVVSGTPSFLATNRYDLAVGFGSALSYVGNTQAQFAQYRRSPVDPFNQLAHYVGSRGSNQGLYRGLIPQSMDFISYEPTDNSIVIRPTEEDIAELVRDMPPQNVATLRAEALYAYSLGSVTLARGARLTKPLFEQETEVESLVKWDFPWSGSDGLTNVLRVRNLGTQPWTTGPIFIIRDGLPLSQIEMPFTAPGKSADLDTGKVQDVIAQRHERELSRATIKDPRASNASASQLDSEFRFSVENVRKEPVQIELVGQVPGDVLSNGGATIEKLSTLQSSYNRLNEVRWRVRLSPGERQGLLITARRID